MILEWFTPKEFYKLPVSVEKKSWKFPYFCKSYCQRKIETFLWATLYFRHEGIVSNKLTKYLLLSFTYCSYKKRKMLEKNAWKRPLNVFYWEMVTEKRKSRLQLFNSDVVFFRFQLGPDTQTAYEHHSCVRFFSIDRQPLC